MLPLQSTNQLLMENHTLNPLAMHMPYYLNLLCASWGTEINPHQFSRCLTHLWPGRALLAPSAVLVLLLSWVLLNPVQLK